MSARLFEPYTIRGVSLRNRIVMSPMCMHSATADGVATDFHVLHYGSRALGGTGLIMTETAAVTPNGPIGPGDLGIWDDAHIPNLRRIVDAVHLVGGRIGVQIGHAGRQLGLPEQTAVAPSAIAWGPESRVPEELTQDGIAEIVDAFRVAAARAKMAGFDVVEVHAAHGFLLNEFLSPISNKRTDEYGGDHAGRYRIVREVVDAVRTEWNGPLFVRISSTDYVDGGNTPEDFIVFGRWMKEQGVDLIDASSGGSAPVKVSSFPGFQVPAAELIRREVGIPTGAVGRIETGQQAEDIVRNGRADLVFIGREMLKDPFWARTAADDLRHAIQPPAQYTRYGSVWQRTQPPLPAAPLHETVAA
ncbi:NADPH dehydrogenase NamA [Paenarthrobacter nicotinovorans]|uniref:NADPH dehydrogenase NamA n=2 Tax=Paenarthrobacter nicotinovorans TaxID=29320 RepID=UPI0016674454|nr:NADPH dehydrogenase NamA [Paenarthrobacter nicotinovorans]UKF00906.1 NADPH dehydrogenase NamA [Paenarthrobacter nicotinovorans]UKF05689.1 NADPH dehydrogenase NamA [Paenarthrobacter nicotinovorans]GGV28324.1 NADPH dehydrogenase [Paenarthrobacter nicotinovorans]